MSKRNPKTLGIWGPNGTRVLASEAMWREPVKWDKDVENTSEVWPDHRPRVFCASLADVFEDWGGSVDNSHGLRMAWNDVGQMQAFGDCDPGDEYANQKEWVTLADVRARLFRLIDATPNLDWLLLTKRPENIRRMWGVNLWGGREAKRENVWLGCSIATQEDADKNIHELLECRDLAPVRFLSIEPLIESVIIQPWMDHSGIVRLSQGIDLDWVIVGGESGPNARPCNVEWIRSLVKQCREAGVPCFVKQLGTHVIGSENELYGLRNICIDRRPGDDCIVRWKMRDPKGGDPSEWPDDLQVREFPCVQREGA
jgi:hypothetical protein